MSWYIVTFFPFNRYKLVTLGLSVYNADQSYSAQWGAWYLESVRVRDDKIQIIQKESSGRENMKYKNEMSWRGLGKFFPYLQRTFPSSCCLGDTDVCSILRLCHSFHSVKCEVKYTKSLISSKISIINMQKKYYFLIFIYMIYHC